MAKDRYLQAVRGGAITAVVLIHCLPQCYGSVAVRPFLNWAVAAFLFLSGYLTSETNVLRGGVLKHRFMRTLPPYVVWSLAYALVLQHATPLGAVKAILTAGASAQLYFVAVYLQLVVLTPALFMLLRRCWPLVYAITPVTLAVYEVITAAGYPLPVLGRLFPFWLVFYIVGLDWNRWRMMLVDKLSAVSVAFGICLALQFAAGFGWLAFGDYNMATTQLKLSSMATSLCAVAALMLLPDTAKRRLASSFLVPLGDASFGIFLCHIFIVVAVSKVLELFLVALAPLTILKWLLSLSLSFFVGSLGAKFLPRSISKVLGLV